MYESTGYRKHRDYVLARVDKRALLEQFAEECCEAAQAALKLIRADKACGSSNPTPVSVEEANDMLVEETCDLLMIADALGCGPEYTAWNPKWKRWAERLGYKEDNENDV